MSIPDQRLQSVFEKLSERIKAQCCLCLRQLASNRNEEIQFGRFIGNPRVTMDNIQETLYQQTKLCSSSCRHCLLIEDTSAIGFSLERSINDGGKVDKGQVQGFYLHPVLCLDAQHYGCYGMAWVEQISREWTPIISCNEQKKLSAKLCFEEKESYRWLSSIQNALPQCEHIATKTVVADREADIYPLLVELRNQDIHYVIRARFDRKLTTGSTISHQVAQWETCTHTACNVKGENHRLARKARLGVRYGKITLRRSSSKTKVILPESHSCYVVDVLETPESCPKNEEPIHWVLLTSHLVDSTQIALQMVEFYRQRWNIEQVFRALKNKGLDLKATQLKDQTKIMKLTLMALVACVKTLQLVKARDNLTKQSMEECFVKQQQECLYILNQQLEGNTEKLKNPYPSTSLAFAAWVIARLGGWKGYQILKPPGPIDMINGLKRFEQIFQGYQIAKNHFT